MRFWSLKTCRSTLFQGSSCHPYIGPGFAARPCSWRLHPYSLPYLPNRRAHVSLSPGFPGAFASWAILPARRLRQTPAPGRDHPPGRACAPVTPFLASVLRGLRVALSAGFARGWMPVGSTTAGPSSLPVLGKPVNPSGLVRGLRRFDARSLSLPIATRSRGFPVRFRVTRFTPRFTGLMVVRSDGGVAFSFPPQGRELASSASPARIPSCGGSFPITSFRALPSLPPAVPVSGERVTRARSTPEGWVARWPGSPCGCRLCGVGDLTSQIVR